ncbi:uncharacterized protein YraI [Streptacidiphilus sp. MAP12-20]|uniref:hypothetical protein n=1 Tax=Streptacidiphilus sp. MAP12-20 TaxID=3156299 RepID=UPI0035123AAA
MTLKSIAVACLAITAATGVILGATGAAQAAETFVHGTVDATRGLNVRSGSPTGAVIDTMPYNSNADLYCWVSGPAVTGPFGTTTVWDAVNDYTTPGGQSIAYVGGTRVFSSDAWLNTGGDTSKMLPHC